MHVALSAPSGEREPGIARSEKPLKSRRHGDRTGRESGKRCRLDSHYNIRESDPFDSRGSLFGGLGGVRCAIHIDGLPREVERENSGEWHVVAFILSIHIDQERNPEPHS